MELHFVYLFFFFSNSIFFHVLFFVDFYVFIFIFIFIAHFIYGPISRICSTLDFELSPFCYSCFLSPLSFLLHLLMLPILYSCFLSHFRHYTRPEIFLLHSFSVTFSLISRRYIFPRLILFLPIFNINLTRQANYFPLLSRIRFRTLHAKRYCFCQPLWCQFSCSFLDFTCSRSIYSIFVFYRIKKAVIIVVLRNYPFLLLTSALKSLIKTVFVSPYVYNTTDIAVKKFNYFSWCIKFYVG